MFHGSIENKYVKTKSSLSETELSAGKSLKKIFRQDEIFKIIENQPASESLLMNRTRLSLFLHLCEKPCDHTRSIARNFGTSLSGINWHLGQLCEKGYLESANINGKRLYWPKGMILPDDVIIVKTLRNEWATLILKAISNEGGESRQKSLVKVLNIKQQNVNIWLGILVSAGLLKKQGYRMETRYRISENLFSKMIVYEDLAKDYSNFILNLLKNDGLMPKKFRISNSRLSVNVSLPSGNRKLHIECNPLAPIRRILNAEKE